MPHLIIMVLHQMQDKTRIASSDNPEPSLAELVDLRPEIGCCNVSQHVVLSDARGKEIGRGKVVQLQGKWNATSLEESETYLVDAFELQAD